jgi:16S rRNA processing protein RimM
MASSGRRAPDVSGSRLAAAPSPERPVAMAPAPVSPARRGADGTSPDSGTDGFVRIGRVSASHGLHGALRVRTDDPDSTILTALGRLFVETAQGRREFALSRASALGAGQFRVVLEGIEDADAAQALKGCAVMAAVADLPPLKEGEFYYFQLVGAEVMLTDGRRLGAIAEIFSTGAHDVWVVRDGGREVLVPVIADVVKAMDLGARRVTIEPLPGLLD